MVQTYAEHAEHDTCFTMGADSPRSSSPATNTSKKSSRLPSDQASDCSSQQTSKTSENASTQESPTQLKPETNVIDAESAVKSQNDALKFTGKLE